MQIRHSAARLTPDLHFYESASPSVGALVADPRVNVLLRPSNCVAAELDRLGKFPFGHPAIDRRPAQPDTVLDFLEADAVRHAFRLCWRRHSTFSHDDLQRSPRHYPQSGHHSISEARRVGLEFRRVLFRSSWCPWRRSTRQWPPAPKRLRSRRVGPAWEISLRPSSDRSSTGPARHGAGLP